MSSNPTYQVFTPTYLYIKQHSITGKLYFGKTVKNPETYYGSGKHWKRHIEQHGKEHVVTLWYCLFYDQESITSFALNFSNQQNIVESSDWLNLIPENGLDGGSTLHGKTGENSHMTGRHLSTETKQKLSIRFSGENNPQYGKVGTNNGKKFTRTEEQKKRYAKSRKDKVTAYNLITNTTCSISKEEFDANKGTIYVGITSKLIPK